ncbi:MAG: hypothetical protein ABSB32_16945 [Thermodesulfobacteriota bacterium]
MNMQTPTSKDEKVTPKEKEETINALCRGGAEVLFIGLPLLVLFIVLHYKQRDSGLLASPEWSFAAAILFGLGLVKLVDSITSRGGVHGERVGLFCALVLVFGLVPSLVVLALVLLSEQPEVWLVATQIILCILGAVVFFICTGLAAMARVSK